MEVTFYNSINKPSNFESSLSVSTCFMEFNSSLLFLKRGQKEICPNQWAIPGGKLNPYESPLEAIIREVHEETSVNLLVPNICKVGKYFVDNPIVKYDLYLFKYTFSYKPNIILSQEHSDYVWKEIRKDAILSLNLIPGQIEAIKKGYSL